MKKFIFLIVLLALVSFSDSVAGDLVIDGYPIGIAGSVGDNFFVPYYPRLQAIADTLAANSGAIAVITGAADKERYRTSHDAKNPGLAIGRATILKRLLMEHFYVDSTQLTIQPAEPTGKGATFRYSSIRIEWPTDHNVTPPVVDTQFLEPRIIIQEVHHNYWVDDLGINLRIGISSSPYGLIPLASGAVVYRQYYDLEAFFGHTLWTRDQDMAGQDYGVWLRFAGGQFIYWPFEKRTLGFSAGWIRVEQIAERYMSYTQKSEGVIIGMRWQPIEWLDVSASYFPNKRNVAEYQEAKTKNNEFLISVSLNRYFGGNR